MSGSRKRREEDRSDSAAGAPGSPPAGDLKAENEALKREITALKASLAAPEGYEAVLEESDEKFRNLLQGIYEGIILNDDKGVILEWNTGMEEIIGISRDDAIGRTIFEVASRCVPESNDAGDGKKWLSAIIDTLDRTPTSRSHSPHLEIAVKHPDGALRTIEVKNFYYTVLGRTFYGGIVRDITDLKMILENLSEREDELNNLIQSSSDAILLTDEEGRITKFNKAQERLTGLAADEVVGLPAWEFQALRSSPKGPGLDPLTWYKEIWDRLLHDENDQFYREIVEDDITSTTGAVHHVQVRAFRIPTKKGFRVGAIVRDITDLKRTEVALLESEEKYRTLIEMSPDAIVIHDGGIILYANPATAHLFHASHPENIIGRDAFTIIHPDSQAISRTVAEKDKEGISTLPTEIQVIRKDGTIMTVEGRGRRIQYQGKPAIEVILRDVTERKKSEQQLREYAANLKRSNEDLELFAYIATHDLQEPIRGIVAYSQLLLAECRSDHSSQTKKYLENIARDGLRLNTLVADLQEYLRVRSGGRPFAPTDMERILQDTLHTLHRQVTETQATITHDPLPIVQADSSQMTQVLQNLLANAMKFQQKGIAPTVHVSASSLDGMWQFSVRDNGVGIPEGYFEKIFILFERLYPRDTYPGTGLGLALCKRIVERHGGRMWVESDEGRGSTFYFTLPVTAPESSV